MPMPCELVSAKRVDGGKFMLKARATVQTLEQYLPPISNRVGLRLDFNENTAGCSPRVLAALRDLTAAEAGAYPNRAAGEKSVARFLAVEPAQVLLTNGVDEALQI